jgi:uncharacterized protein YjbI with pentapeptide repeats
MMYIKDALEAHRHWLESKGESGERADLHDAILQEADLHGADLQQADMNGARMSVSDLKEANLAGADMRNADVWMSDMTDANLEGTDLRGVDLTDVTGLTSGQLSRAVTDEKTKLPSSLSS